MTQHTPGPWVVKVRGDHAGSGSGHYTVENPTYEGPCPCGAKHPPGALIAWFAGGLGDADVIARSPERARHDADAEANARLVAAAPDLLGALRDLAERLRRCSEEPILTAEAYDSFYQELVAAAIAKAEGK